MQLLGDFDTLRDDSVEYKWEGTKSLVVRDLQVIERFNGTVGAYAGTVMQGGFLPAASMQVADECFSDWRPSHGVRIESNIDLSTFCVPGQMAMLLHVQLRCDNMYIATLDKDVGEACIWTDVMPTGPPMPFIDFFCGGIGGWGLAAQFLTDLGFPLLQVAALDHNESVTNIHQLNHGGQVVFRAEDLPDTPPPGGMTHVVQGFTVKRTMKLQRVFRPSLWTMSFPCPPWSRSGNANGLFTEEGRTFVHALGALKSCRPPIVLLENVSSIVEHHHWPALRKAIQSIGYVPVWEQTINAAKLLPCQRNRWLCILVDVLKAPVLLPMPEVSFPRLPNVTVASFRSLLQELPQRLMSMLQLTDEALAVYGDKKYARNLPGVTPWMESQEVLRARVLQPDTKATTFMASYGRQHKLPQKLLLSQGLHTQFVEHHGNYRLMSPHEMLMMLGVHCDNQLGRDTDVAWLCVGNAISPVHAVIAFGKLLNMLGEDLEPAQLACQYVDSCIRADRAYISDELMGWKLRRVVDDPIDDLDFLSPTMHFEAGLIVKVFHAGGISAMETDGTLNAYQVCQALQISVLDHEVCTMLNGRVLSNDEVLIVEGTLIHVLPLTIDPGNSLVERVLYLHNEFIKVEVPADAPAIELWDALRFDRDHQCDHFPILVFGRALDVTIPLVDQAVHHVLDVNIVRRGQVLRLTGGGGPRKQQLQEKSMTFVAKLLIDRGCSITMAQQHAQTVLTKLGHQTVSSAMGEGSPPKQWKVLQDAAKTKSFQLMPREVVLEQSASKIQQLIRKKQNKKPQVPSTQGLSLQEGWFFNTDGSSAALHREITPGSSGVVFVDMATAHDYLQNDAKLSTDEYALVIPCSPDTTPPKGELIKVPVKDACGTSAIIAALLVQIGEKMVRFGQESTVEVKTEALTNVQITAFREHMDPSVWDEFVAAPVKCSFARFSSESIRTGVSRVWGRAFFKGKVRCEATEADSLSFFAAICDDVLEQLLQESGLNQVFMRPRQEGSEVDSRFSVVWATDRVAAEMAIAKLPGHRAW
eukprot:Skav232650  [mRNA]  locus=scaffold2334:176474:179678:+ [translate_table: standard]